METQFYAGLKEIRGSKYVVIPRVLRQVFNVDYNVNLLRKTDVFLKKEVIEVGHRLTFSRVAEKHRDGFKKVRVFDVFGGLCMDFTKDMREFLDVNEYDDLYVKYKPYEYMVIGSKYEAGVETGEVRSPILLQPFGVTKVVLPFQRLLEEGGDYEVEFVNDGKYFDVAGIFIHGKVLILRPVFAPNEIKLTNYGNSLYLLISDIADELDIITRGGEKYVSVLYDLENKTVTLVRK